MALWHNVFSRVIGTKNERELKRLQPLVAQINELEPALQKLSDPDLRAKTGEFRERLERGATLDEILPEAFATVREVARRVLDMRHFDVQLIGGAVLHEGKITEMATGEGKTLVATLPVYLNALQGRGVHIVTVNDYLAMRDSQWMGGIYQFLGLNVGLIQHDMLDADRQRAYAADVTYGTNNEFGFDYLRDNMKFSLEEMVQPELHYAIVDEVDSILIDEARTPLIISGPADESTDLYYKVDRVIPRLKRAATITEGKLAEIEAVREGDFIVDEKAKTVAITEQGVAKVENVLGISNLYDPSNIDTLHHVQQALKAHNLFQRDVDYMVKDGQVIIVDEFTGRLMPGRRWSDGLHQAVEAKEKVKIERENQTLATITFQNYFRMYAKLAGMTGTADTEAAEFAQIYNLDVMIIPTNRDLVRTSYPDVIYRTEREKLGAVVEEIAELHEKGRPVLVGTTSIEKSEKISALLKRQGVPHQVLNAKYHEREAEIIAQAGRNKAVTIATNMAGRGTDIVLGGHPHSLAREMTRREDIPENVDAEEMARAFEEAKRMQQYGLMDPDINPEAYGRSLAKVRPLCNAEHDRVVELGGLHILATERHEARRIDNQLRGRSGRQGDPGSSRFYLSLEDDLLRIFGGERLQKVMDKLGMQEGEVIEHGMVTKAIETAQKRVEAHNFEIRKHLLEYDDVMNRQRQIIYGERRKILEGENLKEAILEMAEDVLESLVGLYANEDTYPEDWDLRGLSEAMYRQFGVEVAVPTEGIQEMTLGTLKEELWEKVQAAYDRKEQEIGTDLFRYLERVLMLQIVDGQWKDHLLGMDHLKEGIGLRGYGQRDPLVEYKREGFELFDATVERIKEQTVQYLFRLQPTISDLAAEVSAEAEAPSGDGQAAPRFRMQPVRPAPKQSFKPSPGPAVAVKAGKVGRNEPCP
ncbi:MAG: preprotein translocase subunit SecA, partial [candidate division NC10 bacterium]|nr:preprotein translocase subunit SecA [candidate division NC10 bacterium]